MKKIQNCHLKKRNLVNFFNFNKKAKFLFSFDLRWNKRRFVEQLGEGLIYKKKKNLINFNI